MERIIGVKSKDIPTKTFSMYGRRSIKRHSRDLSKPRVLATGLNTTGPSCFGSPAKIICPLLSSNEIGMAASGSVMKQMEKNKK